MEVEKSQLKLEQDRKHVLVTRMKSEHVQKPLRHVEEAEAVVLKRQEAAEASLVQALDTARIAAAEAHEDAGGDADESDAEKGFRLDLLAASCKERLKDREQRAQESEAAHKETGALLEVVREQLQLFRNWKPKAPHVPIETEDSAKETDSSSLTARAQATSTLADEQPEVRLQARIADL